MSKILDLLKQEGDQEKDHVQEQLAEIYISPTKKKPLPENDPMKKASFLSGGWIWLAAVLFLISISSIILLFSNNKISVSVNVTRQVKSLPPKTETPQLAARVAAPKIPDMTNLPAHSIEFGGSAVFESKITDEYLYLANSRAKPWANARIVFRAPVNLTKYGLSFSVKGGKGRESLLITLKDTSNMTYQGINAVPGGLSRDWRKINIYPKKETYKVNLESIREIGLEFGSATANNPAGGVIYVKDIILIKRR